MTRSGACWRGGLVALLPLVAAWPAPPPKIISITPDSGMAGANVTIRGSDFGATQGRGLVRIGFMEARILNWADAEIQAQVLPGTGTGLLNVLQNDQWSNGVPFTVPASPASPGNGILVSPIKVYDDQALQQMLNSARKQLASLQVFDQASLISRLGTLQGANVQQSAFGINVGGPPVPGVQTTANTGNTTSTQSLGASLLQNTGGTVLTANQGVNAVQNSGTTAVTLSGGNTSQTTTGGTAPGTQNSQTGGSQLVQTAPSSVTTNTGSTQLVVTGPSGQTGSTTSNQTQVTGPGTQTVTTQPVIPVPTAALPGSAGFSLPSAFNVSSSNILNEQLQLSSEIMGYELLLEGSLSDRFMRFQGSNGPDQLIRPRTTIGVPVSIDASGNYQDAVAEVILEVTTTGARVVAEAPAITALLPREKTYNVASITDKSALIGGGIATQAMTAGVSFLWGHKTFYVVQDQDTIALQLPSDPLRPTTTRFGWQFRPVLGQKTVRGGMRMAFVQLAFPVLPNVTSFGTVRVITRWKRLKRKTGILDRDPIPDSISVQNLDFDIPRFDLKPHIEDMTTEDNGDGSLTVSVVNHYLPGTFVRVGAAAFLAGSSGSVFEANAIRFTIPAIQLATHAAYLVDRSGEATEIVNALAPIDSDSKCLTITPNGVTTRAVSPAATLVTVTVDLANRKICVQQPAGPGHKPSTTTGDLVVVVGNRLFGLKDSPLKSHDEKSLSFLAPTDLLQAWPRVTVKRLFWGRYFEDAQDLVLKPRPAIAQATLVKQSETELKVALMGSGLTGLTPVAPAGIALDPVSDSGAILTIPVTSTADFKQMVFMGPTGELLLVATPAPDSPASPQLGPHAALKMEEAVTISIAGSGLDSLEAIEYKYRTPDGKTATLPLKFEVAKDKKSVSVEVPRLVTAKAGTPDLEFVFRKANRVKYPIAIFERKVDNQPPPPAK